MGEKKLRERGRDHVAFLALLGFVGVVYVAPGEWIEALAPLRLALATSVVAAAFERRGSVRRWLAWGGPDRIGDSVARFHGVGRKSRGIAFRQRGVAQAGGHLPHADQRREYAWPTAEDVRGAGPL